MEGNIRHRIILALMLMGFMVLHVVSQSKPVCGYCNAPKQPSAVQYPDLPSDSPRLNRVMVFFRHGARSAIGDLQCLKDRKRGGLGIDGLIEPGCLRQEVSLLQTEGDSPRFPELVGSRAGKVYVREEMASEELALGRPVCVSGNLVQSAPDQFEAMASVFMASHLKDKLSAAFKNYDAGLLYLRSTDTHRTLGSMNLLIKALSQKSGDSNTDLRGDSNTDLFPVHVVEVNDSLKLKSTDPEFLVLKEKLTGIDEYIKQAYSGLYSTCSNEWSAKVRNIKFENEDVFECLTPLFCAIYSSLCPLKECLSSRVVDCSFELERKYWQVLYGHIDSPYKDTADKYARKAAQLILDSVSVAVEGNAKAEVFLFASHDDTLAALLAGMIPIELEEQISGSPGPAGMWDGEIPKYASYLVLEEYSDSRVRVVYDGKVVGWIKSPFDKSAGKEFFAEQRDVTESIESEHALFPATILFREEYIERVDREEPENWFVQPVNG